MKRGIGSVALIGAALLAAAHGDADGADRRWSARESVEMTYFGERGGRKLPQVSVSPDGKRFFFQTRRGDLATDSNIYDLRVFDVASVSAAVRRARQEPAKPLQVFTLSSTSNHPGINGALWSEDSQSIVFLGAKGDDAPQVYIADVDVPGIRKLTNAPLGVESFEYRAGSVMFSARVGSRSVLGSLAEYPASVVTLRNFNAAISRSESEVDIATFAAHRGGEAKQVGEPLSLYGRSSPRFWLSPDGGQAIVSSRVLTSELPAHWRPYEQSVMSRMVEIGRLSIVDVESGATHTLLDAPVEHSPARNVTQVLWSPDGRRAIITNVALPQNGMTEPPAGVHLVDYDVAARSWRAIAEITQNVTPDGGRGSGGPAPTLTWIKPGRHLAVTYAPGSKGKSTSYELASGDWKPRAAPPEHSRGTPGSVRDVYGGFSSDGKPVSFPNGLQVTIEQGLNTPPVAMARSGKQRVRLTPADERIAGAERSTVRVIEWVDAQGRARRGGLLLPRNAAAGERFPLVLQIYDFIADRFLPDGFVPLSAYAAQPLASEGIAVFQLQARKEPLRSADIGPAIVEDIDAAVAHLARTEPIDASRVGLIGFSFGAYQVDYALTNPRATRFSAAVSVEGFTASYGYYLLYSVLNEDSWRQVAELGAYYPGEGTFWENKASWMERAPGFNLDRITAPLLLTSSGGSIGGGFGLYTDLELYAGLKISRKPFDYLYFPKGGHPLQRPRERFTSQQASVDWMRFWLKGEEDADASKAQQYVRWRALRDAARAEMPLE